MADSLHQGRVAGTHWDPAQYARFGDHRLRPALELLARVTTDNPAVVYDLGCGSGEVTRMIAARWPGSRVWGVDNSAEMLARASATTGPVTWQNADIREWVPEVAPDLIYTNAALQWVEDHETLFPGLARLLNPGGCLAVQMPLSWGMPSHRLMREVLENGGPGGVSIGSDELRTSMARQWVADPEVYFDLLRGCASEIDIWTTTYLQVLEGENPVVEWVKGTGLRPILNDLDEAQREQFLAEYTRRIARQYPVREDGRTVYPFERLFIVVTA